MSECLHHIMVRASLLYGYRCLAIPSGQTIKNLHLSFCPVCKKDTMMYDHSDVITSVFIDYVSQLESPKWHKRRDEILARDKHRCRMCGKGKSVWRKFNDTFYNFGIDYSCSDISVEDIIQTKFSVDEFKLLINAGAIELKVIQESGVIAGVSDNGILGVMDSNAISASKSGNASEKVEFNLVRHKSGMLYFLVNLKDADLSKVKTKTAYLTETPLFLNVHHKHYIIQHKAWEYDDEDLVTLCNECHTKVHQSIGAPVYSDKNGFMKEIQLTPCLRCGGTGYFPEYKHVEHGICFRCRGARFEELIQCHDNTTKEDLPF